MRTRLVAIAAVVVLATAGCTSHDPKPRSSPPAPSTQATTQASPTPSGPLTTGPGVLPGEKPPVLPAAAKEHTSAGALAFAGYYFKALDWSTATTDPYLVQRISSPSCQACERVIGQLSSLRRQHGYVSGGRIQVVSAKLVAGTFKVKSDYVIEALVDEDAIVLSRPSAPTTTSAAKVKNDPSLVFVSWAASGWKILEVGAPS